MTVAGWIPSTSGFTQTEIALERLDDASRQLSKHAIQPVPEEASEVTSTSGAQPDYGLKVTSGDSAASGIRAPSGDGYPFHPAINPQPEIAGAGSPAPKIGGVSTAIQEQPVVDKMDQKKVEIPVEKPEVKQAGWFVKKLRSFFGMSNI